MPQPADARDVVVIGAGVIGLGIAWRCSQRGLRVTIVDPTPGAGASSTAAGMLAPLTELHFGEQVLFAINLESARRYPAFVEELEDVTGRRVGYRQCGTVVAAWDSADMADLRQLARYATSLGHPLEVLGARELRRSVPQLASGLPGGLLATDDHQVDNRQLHAALLGAGHHAGVQVRRESVVGLTIGHGGVTGVQLSGGSSLAAGTVVLAAGAWSVRVPGLPPEVVPPVRPVKGQTLRLRLDDEVITRVVRGRVKGNAVYVVPRSDGEVVVGASSEEAGFDVTPRAGAVYELLRDAQSLLPVLGEAELVEVSTSLRPGTPDNAPILGPTAMDGLLMATGHYRNGILLTPLTADAIADLIIDGALPEIARPFAPERREPCGATA